MKKKGNTLKKIVNTHSLEKDALQDIKLRGLSLRTKVGTIANFKTVLPDLAVRVWKIDQLETFAQKESARIAKKGIQKKIIMKQKNKFLREATEGLLYSARPTIKNEQGNDYLEVEVQRPDKRSVQ